MKQVEVSKTALIKVTAELHHLVKFEADKRGMTMRGLVTQAVLAYLKEKK